MDARLKLSKNEESKLIITTEYRKLTGNLRYLTHTRPTVALSSCESEFYGCLFAACQALWLQGLLSELTGREKKKVTYMLIITQQSYEESCISWNI